MPLDFRYFVQSLFCFGAGLACDRRADAAGSTPTGIAWSAAAVVFTLTSLYLIAKATRLLWKEARS